MRIALVVPGGVDPSAEYRVIPALLALIARLARAHDVLVFALAQQDSAATWPLLGARIHNIGTRATRRRAVRAILAAHRESRFDLVHSIWSGSCGLVAVVAAKLLRIPSLIHVAGGELAALPDIGYGGSLTWRARLRERVTLRAASAVSAASAPLIQVIGALGVAARRVPLGVDLGVWPVQEPRRRAPEEQARLIHVASLNRIKDQPTLLQALAILARAGVDFRMDLVGEDTLAGEMQSLSQRLGLAEHVTFHGFLPQRLARPLLEAAHLLIVSSRHEAGPVVALEAAAVGVPTVGTAVGHLAEWAPQAALTAPIGNAPALADAIRQLLTDEALRLAVAAAAQRLAVREDADYTARSFETLYANLTGGSRRHGHTQ